MSSAKAEKSQVFKDKRGQDRRQNIERATQYQNNRRRKDRRTMEFSERPWWLQRSYVDISIETRPSRKRIKVTKRA